MCGGVGQYRLDVPFGDPRFGKLYRCECKGQEDAARLQRLSGLTDTERLITLDQIETGDRPGTLAMVAQCQKFVERPFGMMTVWGGSGNAKTMALQAVVNYFVDAQVEAVYVTAFDLISYIRSAFHRSDANDLQINDGNAYQRLIRFANVRILAVDEFDKVNVTAWVQEQLTDLIDRRYRLALDEQAGTLLAMNEDPRSLPSWMYSRLAQNTIIHNHDSDMRPVFGTLRDPRTGEILE